MMVIHQPMRRDVPPLTPPSGVTVRESDPLSKMAQPGRI
jgi:hypothetical protein